MDHMRVPALRHAPAAGVQAASTTSFEAATTWKRTSASFNRQRTSLNRPVASLNRACISLNRAAVSFKRPCISLNRALASFKRPCGSLEDEPASLNHGRFALNRARLKRKGASDSVTTRPDDDVRAP